MPLPESMSPLFRDALLVVRVGVAWGDMDALGHVNNVMYFRYFETARVALCAELGLTLDGAMKREGVILHSVQCRFRRAIVGPDVAYVGASVSEVSPDRMTVSHVLVSERQHAADPTTIAAEGSGIVVGFDYQLHQKVPLPRIMLERLESLRAAARSGGPKFIE